MNNPALPAQDEYLLDKILLEITALRWQQALTLFSELSVQDATATQLKRLTVNMMAAQQHRAILYNQLSLCIEQGKLNLHYRPAPGGHGEWETVAHETDAGAVLDNAMQNPRAQAKRKLADLQPGIDNDGAVAVVGIEDGYTLAALGKVKSPFGDGRATPIFAIEPDPERVLAVFQIHDWADAGDPLVKPAFEWIVGKDWSFELRNRLLQDPMLPVPTHALAIRKGLDGPLFDVAREVAAQRLALATERHREYQAKKALCSKRAVAKFLLENPKRLPAPPRVAVIGSRFNRRSARLASDIARALAGQGWKVAAIVENNERQRLTTPHIEERVAQCDPNLVVCVHQPLTDGDALDPNTPTLRFGDIPDDATGQESFVRVAVAEPLSLAHLKAGDRGIVSPGVMAPINLPSLENHKVPRVVILADAPEPPVKMLRRAIEACQNQARVSAATLVERVGHALLDHYEKGHSLSTLSQLEALLDRSASGANLEASRREALERLWPINEALYSLHTAQWTLKACEKIGAELRLYGANWNLHPHLAANHMDLSKARGGRTGVAQSATVCIHAHPGFCLNEELLSLVSDGAFLLLRDHPLNQALPALAAFMAKNAPNAKDAREAAAIVAAQKDETVTASFKRLNDGVSKLLPKGSAEPVTMVRSCARSGVLDAQMQALPHLAEISFNHPDNLGELILRWHGDREGRQSIIREQQEALHGRLAMEPTLLRAIYLLARRFVANG